MNKHDTPGVMATNNGFRFVLGYYAWEYSMDTWLYPEVFREM